MIKSVDIIIPTIKTMEQVEPQIKEIENTTRTPCRIIVTCLNRPASINRNVGIKHSETPFIIMLDDDVTGFFYGWDVELLFPFSLDPQLHVISARLINRNGTPANNCADNYDMSGEYIYILPKRYSVIPTAAIAFKNIGILFDEHFIGSGWEDNDFMFQYIKKISGCKFMINNNCKLIHLNEMKYQQGKYWIHNNAYFCKKWNR